ncbi:type IV toxin-antitoxin system YeeU family antitoxin, partial [Escherichia coli]|nr:type IV toxin-antitoxin system YeeU family antitoxin [Escherichia coli]MBB9645788.1 type IV toxin-antitoxin system YeeU family antitoxin [Escherichia coli]MBB9976931.1 type IV toxin-antitoxin system YeeU family antitoxin [Escherichia coli]MBC0221058.1 type IV toxin-antitoxin system YeeU family antitoxin [Escherichia coli]MBC0437944.1 type IV toxin-antitoxin system YeeU family antitoxin [Escherichia coli]
MAPVWCRKASSYISAGIRGRFSDADAYHPDQAFSLLMKQLELMLTSGELNPR